MQRDVEGSDDGIVFITKAIIQEFLIKILII
jgi:hypothetical protein